MNKFYTLTLGIIISFSSYAQNNQGFKYQAIIRDAAGNVNANASVNMEISILQGSAEGTSVFVESHDVTSNTFGLVNLTIGSQNPADFSLIDWANGPYFIKILVDGIEFGTSQLLSVPYALHAKTAESVNETDPLFTESMAASITQTQIDNWTNKLSEFAETNPNFDASVAAGITQTQIESWTNKLSAFIETDPEFAASLSKGITATDTAYWNSKLDAFTETDPTFLAHPSAGITEQDITMWKALWIWYTTNTNGYLTSEVDGSVTNEIQVLSINNDTVYLEKGGFAKLPAEIDPSIPTATESGQMLYWNGTSWTKVASGQSGQILVNINGTPTWVYSDINPLSVGDDYQGGKIFYILQLGDTGYDPDVKHGLIVASTHQSSKIRWYNGSLTTIGTTKTGIGTGLVNTNAIISSQGAEETSYAAGIARAYTGGGYTDWYLPSRDELEKLYNIRNEIGGFTSGFYWTSSESSGNKYVWGRYFISGSVNQGKSKDEEKYVRAIRSF